ncbi:Serine/threonine-protein kinase pksC [Minicystis rosea]|nr:Serine/threonine-protein kinase pksC [Minicystis rosea]
MSLAEGRLVNGKYRVVRLIGEGGMGSVYEAMHEGLNARVALKSLHPDLAKTGLGPRFLQEARAAARLKSPHVVRVSDVDQTEEGLPFMVLEFLEGKTLQALYEHLYKMGDHLQYADALDFAIQICEGVEAAHEAGIVHRDLKPDNVMITTGPKGNPLLKLLDFGIAKLEDKSDPKSVRTRPGVIMGTPEYMAPEQAFAADTADARADVFSLGVMIFEMLAGHRPVGGDDPTEIAVSYLTGKIPHLRDIAPTVPPEIDAVVFRAMAPKPADRLPSVKVLREALEPFLLATRPPHISQIAQSELPGARPVPGTNIYDNGAHNSSPYSVGIPTPAASPVGGEGFGESTKKSTPYAHDVHDNRFSIPVVSPAPMAPAPMSMTPSGYPMAPAPMSVQQFPYGPTTAPTVGNKPKGGGGSVALVAGIAIALLLLVGGGAVWAVYYFTDVFDEPAKKPTKKPGPAPQPTTKKAAPSLR